MMSDDYQNKILVVDDQPDNLIAIVDFLEESGEEYEIYQAINGEMAVKVARHKTPDLIIMDWEMPVLNGIDAIKILKKDETTKDIPVIMASGVMISSANLKTALDSGAVDYIRKPIDKIELTARVKSMLIISKSYREIKALNEAKSRLFSIIGHDLMGPVGNIKSALEIIVNNYKQFDEASIKDLIASTNQTAGSTYNLLENLLLWARSKSGTMSFKPIVFELKDLILEVVALVSGRALSKSIQINIEQTNEINVFADRNMVSTIVRNLLSNSIKFTHRNGRVVIKTSFDNDFAIISIQDNGIGITEKNIKKILTPASHFITRGTDSEKGSGLGLSLSIDFIKQNNGEITVKSEPDNGSCFSFTLPVA